VQIALTVELVKNAFCGSTVFLSARIRPSNVIPSWQKFISLLRVDYKKQKGIILVKKNDMEIIFTTIESCLVNRLAFRKATDLACAGMNSP